MSYTFKGGLHPEENKITSQLPIENFPAPEKVAIAMSQHIGAPCVPTVKKGDHVLKGQLIGESDAGLTCPVHSSVSGTVADIIEKVATNGRKVTHVVIENDFNDELSDEIKPIETPLEETPSEVIVEKIRTAGISGMGGATFPTHFKIQSGVGRVKKLIINCCECEPYITANHRLMLESADEIIDGIRIVLHCLNIHVCDIAVEDNKKDAVKLLTSRLANDREISVKVMKTKYPQGDERQLIYAIDKLQIPTGKLPADVERMVLNAETTAAVSRAVRSGMPLIERVITVSGDNVTRPGNFRVPLGTSISDIANYCGVNTDNLSKIISGGPMMGAAQWDIDAPVIKGTASLLFFKKEEIKKSIPEDNCIHCGKCVGSCPMHLMPLYFAAFGKRGEWEEMKNFDVLSCVECGCCTYQCPGRVPIVQYIRTAKGKLKK